MKRLAAALAALMMLCLCACGPAKPAPDSQDETPPPQAEEPAPPPEPTEEELAAQEIDDLLASLTTEEKVGQLFFVRCPAISPGLRGKAGQNCGHGTAVIPGPGDPAPPDRTGRPW